MEKKRLRDNNVNIIEYDADYTVAVRKAREMATGDPLIYFVDDEHSRELFLGYSVAALRLKRQLSDAGVVVDNEHPLFVYIPCGVGGAPGGITFGLKHIFGDAVHCFFAEPTKAPCMLLGLSNDNVDNGLSIYDIGLRNDTEADGLAVGRASILVQRLMRPLLSGCFTITDDTMFRYLYQLDKLENLQIEPSAAAGFDGPGYLLGTASGREYIESQGLRNYYLSQANHVLWTTGGMLVPETEFLNYLKHNKNQLDNDNSSYQGALLV